MIHMKKLLMTVGVMAAVLLVFSSCRTVNGAYGEGASQTANTQVHSINWYNLDISETPIQYTIDITTPDGMAKLKGLSLKEAENLVLREAVMQHNCALIFNPQYKYILSRKRVMRITVYGFPASYKKK